MKTTSKKKAHSHSSQTEAPVADVATKETDMTLAATSSTATAASAAVAPTTSLPTPSLASVNIPTEDQVTQLVALLDGVKTTLGSAAVALTREQRRRALRAKRGGETTTSLMITLATQYNVQLPGVDPQQLQQYALLIQRLQPLATKLRVVSGLIDDTVGNAQTESWQGTTQLYTSLARVATRNAVLQKELEPAVAFFKKTKRGTGASAAPAADTAAAASPAAATAAAPSGAQAAVAATK